jgi:hypothetical protein
MGNGLIIINNQNPHPMWLNPDGPLGVALGPNEAAKNIASMG